MITYITAFIFYTLAMVGIMLIGFVVYKKTTLSNRGENKGMMKVLDCLQIAPKKNLLVVRVRNEKFLIASGAEHTTFLAKLQDDGQNSRNFNKNKDQFREVPSRNESFNENPVDYMSKYSENEQPKDEFQRARLDKIQKQFRELYEIEPPKKEKDNLTTRKEAVKQLLRELNETTSAKTGSRF